MKARVRAFFSAVIGVALLAPGRAEVVVRGGVVLNGNVVIGPAGAAETKPSAPDPTGPQVLDFMTGERLHGTLEALDFAGGRLIWRRPDAVGPLVIPLTQISGLRTEATPAAEVTPQATIKFTGGDWLAAEVTAIQGDKIQLRLRDGTRLTTDRAHVEWIYFSKSAAAECYDGPTSLAGWNSVGAWTYRDGALRATAPAPIARMFAALPDRVEYRLTVDQGELVNAFTLALHGRHPLGGLGRGGVQIMVRASSLQLRASVDGNFKTVQVDLTKLLGEPGARAKEPMRFRVFEDFTGGRLLVYINEQKAAEWTIDKGEPGGNGGGWQFQPTSWSGEKEQSLTNIKVLPWDGREPDEEAPTADYATLVGGALKTGQVASWNGRTLKLGAFTVRRDELVMLRFRRPENPPDDAAPIAQVRLHGGGEFDATGLGWREGKLLIRTNFGGEVALAPAAVGGLDFPRLETLAPETDVLVFRNGDRLRGVLAAADGAGRLSWRPAPSDAPVELVPGNFTSLLFAARPPGLPGSMVARFRNGDWIGGTFLALDGGQLVIETADAGQIRMPRALVKALYFGGDAPPAVSDGASDHEIWERGLPGNAGTSPKPAEVASPWVYAAGAFTPAPPQRADSANRGRGLQLGRTFETLAPRVEMNFTVTAEQGPIFFTAQLFSDPVGIVALLIKEPGNRGYMMHVSTVGLSIYDMSPRAGGRGIVQQHFPFGETVKRDARERQLQILADRTTGRMTVLVDGVVTARMVPKPADSPRQLGRGVTLAPQSSPAATFSNLWIGPWNGRVPDTGAGGPSAIVALANGDEVEGAVEMGTPTLLKIASEVGDLELPIERVTMVDFGGSPVTRGAGARLHLAGQGALTVSAWRIEKESLICRSEIAGELTLPLTAVQEIVFAPPPATAAAH